MNRPKSLPWIRSTPQRSKRTLLRAALGVVVGIGLIAVPDAARAAPTNSNGWITDVDVEPTTLYQGQSVSLDISVTAAVARVGLVDVEINTLEGDRTYQQFWDAQTFAAGVTRHFHVNWPVPANADTGSYIVRVGIFSSGWGDLYHWNHIAATFRVRSSDSTPPPVTTAPPPVTTPPPPVTTPPPPVTTAPPPVTTPPPPVTTVPPVTAPPVTAPPVTAPPVTLPPPTATGRLFTANFETAGDFYDRFQMQVSHGVEPSTVAGAIHEWSGDHDMGCGGPDTQRTVHAANHAEMFWWCAPGGDASKGHVMTSMNTFGYSIVSFSPRQTFRDVSRVCWDQNLTDLGGRKWTMMLVLPESEYQSNGGRLDYVVPGFGNPGEPGGNQLIPSNNALGVKVHVGTMTTYSGRSELGGTNALYKVADKARRYRHCAEDLGNGQIRVSQDRDGGTRTWTLPGRFPDGPVRVVFEDDNYDPPKSPPEQAVASPFTWHWDNITVD